MQRAHPYFGGEAVISCVPPRLVLAFVMIWAAEVVAAVLAAFCFMVV